MSFAVVNTANLSSGAGISTLTIPSTVANNLGVLAVSLDHASTGITSVPTGWTRIGTTQNDAGTSQDSTSFYKILTAGETSINWTNGWDAVGLAYAEFSGCATSSPLDVSDTTQAYTTSASGTPFSSKSITPAGTGELILGLATDQGGAPTFTQGAGYALAVAEPGINGGAGGAAIEWKTGGSGSTTASFTVNTNGDSVTVQIAAFLALGGGGGGGGSNAPEKLRVVQSSQRW